MGNDSYNTKSGSLKLHTRLYLRKSGNNLRWVTSAEESFFYFFIFSADCCDFLKNLYIINSQNNIVPRYSSDIYDRIWESYFQKEWTQISTMLNVSNSNDYKPPKTALKTAATPTNTSAPLTIAWSSENPEEEYYLYTHFSEIQALQENDLREFNMVWNGVQYFGPVTPPKLGLSTIFSRSPETCDGGECSVQLIRNNRSTHPPLLNAYEVYKGIQFPQSETNETDGAWLSFSRFTLYFFIQYRTQPIKTFLLSASAVRSIAASYAFSRINWQGDPCFPQQLRWDGLNCTNADRSVPPRITSL